MRWSAALSFAFAVTAASLDAQAPGNYTAPPQDVQAVTEASFGYIDALYKVDTSLVAKYVHPALAKRGYWRNREGVWQESPMTYAQLLTLSGRWNKDGKQAGPSSPREVKVLEVLDHTAITRVTAEWGVDYLALGKTADGWKIVNIIWQELPKP